MKILNAKQLAKVDHQSMEIQHITSWELMERAALNAFSQILSVLKNTKPDIKLFCGIGNNGGDGLAIAYHLYQKGYVVKVYVVAYSENSSPDFKINLKRLHDETTITIETIYANNIDAVLISKADVVIDAIFGVGLNRKMPDFVEDLIQKINNTGSFKIAIDVPSGMFINEPTPLNSPVLFADLCFTFELPKLAFLLPETGKYIQQWKLIPIGLSNEAITEIHSQYVYMSAEFIQKIHQPRMRFSHKGNFGNALLVGGQKGMIGSILFASKAAMRSGLGKLQVMLPASGQTNLHQFVPEAMSVNHTEFDFISYTEVEKFDALGIGMGIGTNTIATSVFKKYLERATKPILVDADGLNILAQHLDWLKLLPKYSILTPHPGELKRLIGSWDNDFEKLDKIQQLATKYQLIIVAKDAYTCICDGSNFYFNSTGNAGMATAGSGDVLCGIITALMAQNYQPFEAAQLGVYVHGLAGDLTLQNESRESLLASDLIANLGKAFQQLVK